MDLHRRRRSSPPASPIATAPEEAFLAFICLVTGFTLLFGKAETPSLEQLLPRWIAYAWAVELMVGGLVVLVGMFGRWVRVEQIGLVTLAFTCPCYALAIIAVVGIQQGLVSVAFLTAYSLACARRAWLIKQSERVLRLIAQTAASMREEGDA